MSYSTVPNFKGQHALRLGELKELDRKVLYLKPQLLAISLTCDVQVDSRWLTSWMQIDPQHWIRGLENSPLIVSWSVLNPTAGSLMKYCAVLSTLILFLIHMLYLCVTETVKIKINNHFSFLNSIFSTIKFSNVLMSVKRKALHNRSCLKKKR